MDPKENKIVMLDNKNNEISVDDISNWLMSKETRPLKSVSDIINNLLFANSVSVEIFCKLKEIDRDCLARKLTNTEAIQELSLYALKNTNLDKLSNIKWNKVSAMCLLAKIYDEYSNATGKEVYDNYYTFLKNMTDKNLYSKVILDNYSEAEISIINRSLDTSRDALFDYAGLNLLSTRYLVKERGNIVELPQYMLMSISLLLALPELPFDRINIAKKIYEAISTKRLSLATPIVLNLRRPNGNLSSCFIGAMNDSLNSIYYSLNQLAQISKNGGGAGINISRVRASGAYIKGVKGASSGIMPWIKLINDTGIGVNQTGSRSGAITVALDIWHLDIEDFLHCQTENGDLRKKAFDIFPQIVIPDLFMERVEANEYWHLFDPNEIRERFGIELAELYGDKFREKYKFLEEQNLDFKKRVSAKELFKTFLKIVVETGMPYVSFKDTMNDLNPNKHAGMIGNANLCVSGDTVISTKDGKFPISDCAEQYHDVWNGEQWSNSFVTQTGHDQILYSVVIEGQYGIKKLKCTSYHKWYNSNEEEFRTYQLKPGMILEPFKDPYTNTHHHDIVKSITELPGLHDTYCLNEPIRHKAIFNDILTGNCTESFSVFKPSEIIEEKMNSTLSVINKLIKPGELHTCNLVSLNLAVSENIEEDIALGVRILDNTIEISTAPVPEANKHNKEYRILGVGSMGLADWLVKKGLTYISGQEEISELYERIALSGVKASIQLSKEREPYPKYEGSDWSKGIVFGKDKEELSQSIYANEWMDVLKELKKYGIRNGGLFAIAPNTSTSLLMGCTASILPIFSKFFIDKAGSGTVPVSPPFIEDNFWRYQENKNIDQNIIVDTVSRIQKWTDQGISMELYLNLNNGIRAKDIYNLYINAWKKKCKTVYYIRSIALKNEKEDCISCAN